MKATMKTYTSTRSNPIAFVKEAYSLYRLKSYDIPGQVNGTLGVMRRFEERLANALDFRLDGKRLLIIGPGQTPREMVYFGLRNEVVGIDLDVIPHGWDARAYMTMLRQNGLMRTVKTMVRKGLGIDAQFERELKRQLGVTTLPRTTHMQMDATQMQFPDASFDFVYSFSVFEHLPDPAAVVAETERVLRPGGACYISLHLYTSEDGCHDMRIFANDREGIPFWSHLRPQYEQMICPNAYLNNVRLKEWQRLFQTNMPGVCFFTDRHDAEKEAMLSSELSRLRQAGDLSDYEDDELLTVNLIAAWKKPDV